MLMKQHNKKVLSSLSLSLSHYYFICNLFSNWIRIICLIIKRRERGKKSSCEFYTVQIEN